MGYTSFFKNILFHENQSTNADHKSVLKREFVLFFQTFAGFGGFRQNAIVPCVFIACLTRHLSSYGLNGNE